MAARSFSNCILFALAFCWRRRKKGDWYFSVRRSHYGPFPHALCGRKTRDGKIRVVSFKPVSPTKRLIPPPLFRGSVTWGDH